MTLPLPTQLRLPSSVRIGGGALSAAGEFFREKNLHRVAVIADPGIVAAGLAERAITALSEAGITPVLFDKVKTDPSSASVEAIARDVASHDIQGVLGIGGGSTLDTAKLVALLLCSPQPLDPLQGVVGAKGERAPLVLVPTTAGSGSEATAVAVVTSAQGRKLGILTRQLLPDLAILDAELTVSLPVRQTAMAGLDAISHALEAAAATARGNQFSTIVGQAALVHLVPALELVLQDGGNIGARSEMIYGSFLAGMSFAVTQTAAMHAFAYYLDAIPHGAAIALVMPDILRANATHAPDLYEALARTALGPTATPEDLASKLADLRDRAGLPATLTAAGIDTDIGLLAERIAGQTYLLENNPKPFDTTEIQALLAGLRA